jgi:hypothetical protein
VRPRHRRDDDIEVNLTRNCVVRRWLRIGPEVGFGEYGYEHSGRRTVKCKDYFSLVRISFPWTGFTGYRSTVLNYR